MSSFQRIHRNNSSHSYLAFTIFALFSMSILYRAVSVKYYGAGLLTASLFTTAQKQRKVACDSIRLASTAISSNPLSKKNSLPLFGEIKTSDILPAVKSDLTQLKSDFSNFECRLSEMGKHKSEDNQYTYPVVVESMEKMQSPLSYSWGVVNHLMGVKNSDDLRAAHDEIQPAVIEINQQIGQSQVVFRALSSLKSVEQQWIGLDECQKRIVNSAIRAMEASGVGLEPEKREKFNKLQLELAELSTKFSNNVLDSTKEFKLKIVDKEQIAGLPESARALAAQQAKATDPGATTENGPWLITMDMPSYLPAMQHLKSRSLRETLYRAFSTRASSNGHDNAPNIKRILQIKTELARMLGYNSYAELSLSTKMAPSVSAVMDLTSMLREKSLPAARRDLDQLRNFAKSQGFSGDLALWDIPYWSERLREKQYEFQEEELRVYFALPTVLDGMFGLAKRLFGVTIEAADGQAQVWNKDVRFFNIKDDKTGEHIASFYLDAYSRPEEKRGGAWMDVCVGKSKVMQRIPVAYLTCNGSPPVGEQPSLMTFREVETLFHEFGHGLQHMLTTVEHGEAAGINNIEWDAVELPSQFMENWCYDKPTLYAFAKHYVTGEPLPDALFDKVKAAKNFQAGLQMLRQLFFGATDMYLHSDKYDANGDKTVFEVQRELAAQYTVIPPLPEDRFLCSFGHIFAGGYSAGYYSYKWAEVMSADAFAAFEEAGLDNEEAVRTTGRRFRETVLSLGGGMHPSDVYKAFRGREPSPDALLRHSGLTDK